MIMSKLDKSKTKIESPMHSLTTGILVVDNHVLVRAGVCELLAPQKGIKIIGQADSGEQAIDLTRKLNPDVILMELNMPGIGGLEATQRILRINPEFKIVALTTYTEEPFPSRFIKAGGVGYLTKNTQVEELVTAIRAVEKGEVYITPDIAQKMVLSQIIGKSKTPLEQLSERELQVMWMITNGNRVNQIAGKLCLSPKTINTYRYRLFDKLGITSDVDLTHLAIRYGLLTQESIEQ